MKGPGSWTIDSSENPVAASEAGSNAADCTLRYSELAHAFGELIEPSNMECSQDYLCFVFEHDGVRDRVRVPRLNDFGLDTDCSGGLCAEVIAPVGIDQNSSGVQGCFTDAFTPSWMRGWGMPE